jgi:hypothetical protein
VPVRYAASAREAGHNPRKPCVWVLRRAILAEGQPPVLPPTRSASWPAYYFAPRQVRFGARDNKRTPNKEQGKA